MIKAKTKLRLKQNPKTKIYYAVEPILVQEAIVKKVSVVADLVPSIDAVIIVQV